MTGFAMDHWYQRQFNTDKTPNKMKDTDQQRKIIL